MIASQVAGRESQSQLVNSSENCPLRWHGRAIAIHVVVTWPVISELWRQIQIQSVGGFELCHI